jgi:hypothetical protein
MTPDGMRNLAQMHDNAAEIERSDANHNMALGLALTAKALRVLADVVEAAKATVSSTDKLRVDNLRNALARLEALKP